MTPRELFDANTSIVGWCFKKYVNNYKSPEFDDIMQEGMLGLWEAACRFDDSKGYKFTTFAVPYVFGRMKHYMRNKTNVIRPPRSVFENSDVKALSELYSIQSLDMEVFDDGGTPVLLRDLIGAPPDEYEFITEDLLESFLDTIDNQMHKDIMEEYYYSYIWGIHPKQVYLAEKYGTCQAQIARIIKKYNQKFVEFIQKS